MPQQRFRRIGILACIVAGVIALQHGIDKNPDILFTPPWLNPLSVTDATAQGTPLMRLTTHQYRHSQGGQLSQLYFLPAWMSGCSVPNLMLLNGRNVLGNPSAIGIYPYTSVPSLYLDLYVPANGKYLINLQGLVMYRQAAVYLQHFQPTPSNPYNWDQSPRYEIPRNSVLSIPEIKDLPQGRHYFRWIFGNGDSSPHDPINLVAIEFHEVTVYAL